MLQQAIKNSPPEVIGQVFELYDQAKLTKAQIKKLMAPNRKGFNILHDSGLRLDLDMNRHLVAWIKEKTDDIMLKEMLNQQALQSILPGSIKNREVLKYFNDLRESL